MGREVRGPEVILSWRTRFPRTDPISDILGANKGNLSSSVMSVIEEGPRKDPNKHPQIPRHSFPFHGSGPDLSPTPGPLIDEAQAGSPAGSGRAAPRVQGVLAAAHTERTVSTPSWGTASTAGPREAGTLPSYPMRAGHNPPKGLRLWPWAHLEPEAMGEIQVGPQKVPPAVQRERVKGCAQAAKPSLGTPPRTPLGP